MVVLQEPAHHIVQRTGIRHIELRRLVVPLHAGIAAHAGARPAADLGNPAVEQLLSHPGAFPGGNDHACIGDGHPEHGHQFPENAVRQGIREISQGDVIGRADAGDTNCVRSHPKTRLQVLRVHEQASQFVPIPGQAEEYADTHIVTAALLGAVHGLRMPVIIALGARGVQLFVLFFVIRFLEKDICANACRPELPVTLHVRCRNVHVHPPDGVSTLVHRVNGADGIQDILQRIVDRVLPCLHGQALVTHPDKGADLLLNLCLGQFLARDAAVFGMVRAVYTAIYAVIGKIQRGKEDNSVAVEFLLDFSGQAEQLFLQGRILTVHENGRLPVREPLAKGRLFQDFPHAGRVLTLPGRLFQGFQDFIVADELIGMDRRRIVHNATKFFYSLPFRGLRYIRLRKALPEAPARPPLRPCPAFPGKGNTPADTPGA